MKKTISVVCFLALGTMPLTAAAYDLSCTNEWSGQNEIVHVTEAKTFEEACKEVKVNPTYGHYKNCKDAEGNKKGKCPK